MPTLDIIQAWKDEAFRDSLTNAQRAVLPGHPSGSIQFQESYLGEDSMAHAPIYTAHCSHHICPTPSR